MTRQPKDLGASMQAKLRNLAQRRGDDIQVLLTQFVLERLLHRLAASPHAGEFVLKGAMLFAAWTKIPHRATRDRPRSVVHVLTGGAVRTLSSPST